jgi:hypothetical protein
MIGVVIYCIYKAIQFMKIEALKGDATENLLSTLSNENTEDSNRQ